MPYISKLLVMKKTLYKFDKQCRRSSTHLLHPHLNDGDSMLILKSSFMLSYRTLLISTFDRKIILNKTPWFLKSTPSNRLISLKLTQIFTFEVEKPSTFPDLNPITTENRQPVSQLTLLPIHHPTPINVAHLPQQSLSIFSTKAHNLWDDNERVSRTPPGFNGSPISARDIELEENRMFHLVHRHSHWNDSQITHTLCSRQQQHMCVSHFPNPWRIHNQSNSITKFQFSIALVVYPFAVLRICWVEWFFDLWEDVVVVVDDVADAKKALPEPLPQNPFNFFFHGLSGVLRRRRSGRRHRCRRQRLQFNFLSTDRAVGRSAKPPAWRAWRPGWGLFK